ncbi:hypothetical protein ACU686_18755 [Yinghuangia aomiensis]
MPFSILVLDAATTARPNAGPDPAVRRQRLVLAHELAVPTPAGTAAWRHIHNGTTQSDLVLRLPAPRFLRSWKQPTGRAPPARTAWTSCWRTSKHCSPRRRRPGHPSRPARRGRRSGRTTPDPVLGARRRRGRA